MKYQILILGLCFSIYQNCSDKSFPFEQFDIDRTTDLVVFNDITEINFSYIYSAPWEIEKYSARFVMVRELLYALMSNAHPVLCNKSLWLLVQKLNFVWDLYLISSPDELLRHHTKLCGPFEISQEFDFKNKIELCRKYIQKLEQKYRGMSVLQLLSSPKSIKELSVEKVKKDIEDLIDQINQKYISVDELLVTPAYLFFIHAAYNVINKYQYICKEVNSDFILFVPTVTKFNNFTDASSYEDMILGLNYSQLPDYVYQNNMPTEQVQIEIKNNIDSHKQNKSLGRSLLWALQKLIITAQDVIRENIAGIRNDFDKARAALPFFNVLIVGHGDIDTMTSEISILKSAEEPVSDFERILQFLNSIKTKTLTIMSCYPSGQKLLNTFDLKNPFNHALLDSITYPIINVGLFANVTYATQATDIYFIFQKYVDFLNQQPPDYQSAFKVISGVFQEDEDLLGQISNFINIKFPHTAWYTPAEFKNLTQTISQIKASTQKSIKINQSTQVVLMGANMVPEIVISSDTGIPLFLPSNYHNQNYVVEHMNASGIQLSIYDCMESFLPLSTIKEPINLVIKKLTLGTGVYTNVCTFTHYQLSNLKLSGYLYTDPDNQTFLLAWPSVDKELPEASLEQRFKTADAQSIIKKIEMQARKGFEKYPSLAKDAVTKLSETIQKKQVQAPQVVQANVIQKYEKKGEKWIQKIAKDVEDVAQEVARV